MSGRRILWAAMLLAVTPVAASVQSRATTIACDVLALNADGLPVTDLAQGDLEVLSDGTPVAITQFAPSARAINVVLLIDGTSSQPLRRYEIQAAAGTWWIPSLVPGDRARIAVLGDPTVLGPWLSADRVANLENTRKMLDRTPLEPSPIWDAIGTAVQALADSTDPRVLVLLTDGRSAANALSLQDAATRAIAAGVSISAVSEGGEWLIPQFGDPPDRARSDVSLKWLADETGGMFLEDGTARRTLRPQMNPFAYVREVVSTPNTPGPLLSRIMSALRARYHVGFAAASDGRTHTLEVRSRRPGVEVRAPRSYVAPKALPGV